MIKGAAALLGETIEVKHRPVADGAEGYVRFKSVVSLRFAGAAPARDPGEQPDRADRLKRRAERELAARHKAERLLESKSLELFAANQRLIQLNADLEYRVEARTRQLDEARRAAVEIGTTDPLTGIANRHFYSEWLERSLSQAISQGRTTGLLLIDLDGFKQVNDNYGHRHGDQLLITVADRLRAAGENDFVARIGGDEFAVIVEVPMPAPSEPRPGAFAACSILP